MCFSQLTYPIINSCASVFEVIGKSNLNLIYTIINRLFMLAVIIFCVKLGLVALMVGKIIHSYASAFLIMFILNKAIKLKLQTQILDVIRILIPAFIMALSLYFIVITFSHFIPIVFVLLFCFIISFVIYYFLAKILNLIELETILFAIKGFFAKLKLIKNI